MLDELIWSSPVSRTPLTHSSKSTVLSAIIGTRSMLPPLALTSPGQRRRNCCEEYFSGCPPVSFEPCQVTQGRRRGEGLRWKLAVPGPLWGTGGSAPPKGRRPKCGVGGGLRCYILLGEYSLAFRARGGLHHTMGTHTRKHSRTYRCPGPCTCRVRARVFACVRAHCVMEASAGSKREGIFS